MWLRQIETVTWIILSVSIQFTGSTASSNGIGVTATESTRAPNFTTTSGNRSVALFKTNFTTVLETATISLVETTVIIAPDSTGIPLLTASLTTPEATNKEPLHSSFTAALKTTFEAPLQSNFIATLETTIKAPLQSSFAAAVETSTKAPLQSSFAAAVETSTKAPLQSSFAAVETSSKAPLQSSFAAAVETSTKAPLQSSFTAVETTNKALLQSSFASAVETSTKAPLQSSFAVVEITNKAPLQSSFAASVETTNKAPLQSSFAAAVETSTKAPLQSSFTAALETTIEATLQSIFATVLETNSIVASETSFTTTSGLFSTITTESNSTESSPDTTTSVTRPTVPTQQPRISKMNIDFKLKFVDKFDPALNNRSSSEFNETTVKYKQSLTSAYKNVTGFKEIIINRFWNGSLGIDYTVVVNSVTPQVVTEQLMGTVLPGLKSLPGINETFLDQTFEDSVKQAIHSMNDDCQGPNSNVCLKDYVCKPGDSGPICEPFCSDAENLNKCQNGGVCVRETPYDIVCRCPVSNTYVYGGQFCEVKAEKLALSKDSIIGIASGSGGALILICIIIIAFVCRRKESKKRLRNDKKEDNTSEQSFKSLKDSEDGLHQMFTGARTSAPLDYNNPTFRLPEVSAKPRTFVPGTSASVIDPLNITKTYDNIHHPVMKPRRQEGEIMRQSRSDSQMYRGLDDLPMHQRMVAQPTSPYAEIDDYNSKSIMYQPTRAMRPLTEFHQAGWPHSASQPKVYDYTRQAESAAGSSHPDSGLKFYDFDYENNLDRRSKGQDPYSINKPHVASQGQS